MLSRHKRVLLLSPYGRKHDEEAADAEVDHSDRPSRDQEEDMGGDDDSDGGGDDS